MNRLGEDRTIALSPINYNKTKAYFKNNSLSAV